MRNRRWGYAVTVVVLAGGPVIGSGGPGYGYGAGEHPLVARPVAPVSRVLSAKTPTARLAHTDRDLLGRRTAEPTPVVIKLNYDPLATYAGDVAGYPATSPAVTGKPLTGASAERRYAGHVGAMEQAFVTRLRGLVPDALVRSRLRTVYGGVAATVPANRIAEVLRIPGVLAVQRDLVHRPLTDASPTFIGANTIYPGLGGKAKAGRGVIVGMLDTGVWPEHPSFAPTSVLSAPPPKADGTARACDFGDNPLTPASDVFVCNNKIIGGAAFLNTYLSNPARAAAEKYRTARDSQGHGTHTASTAAGDVVDSAVLLGTDRGPIHGIAPGAWLSIYKVCGAQGCYSSDAAAAVQQAILDGVNVINYSIGGGTETVADPVELAFLDAYAAGVFVSTAAGNDGPTAGTVEHLSPWVTTVGATTQARRFTSTLSLRSTTASATFTGASITQGVGSSRPVLGSAAPYNRVLCDAPAAAGTFTGKIVVCQEGGLAPVEKSFNVRQGGAVGMILYSTTGGELSTGNFWLPTVHLASGTALLAFIAAHTSAMASFTTGAKTSGQGDVLAGFSSRGPSGPFLKPDLAAPGVEILAGQTPTPDSVSAGPPGQYYQVTAGTSMSAPHVAGSAALLKAVHANWTPGQIKSALMTTATTKVVRADLTSPADPFDVGAGRVALAGAASPGLTFDETADRMALFANDPLAAVDLNLPSIEMPVMPGRLTTWRTARNVTGVAQAYTVHTSAPADSYFAVNLAAFTLNAGSSVQLTITVISSAAQGWHFGEIQLEPTAADLPTLHIPVAFATRQGGVELTSSCAPTTIGVGGTSTCTVTAVNQTGTATVADLATTASDGLTVTGANGATVVDSQTVARKNIALPGVAPGTPSIAPGASPAGYVSLAGLGVTPNPIGDEEIINFAVPSFVYNGISYGTIGVDVNGYIVVGGGTAADNNCCSLLGIPDPTPPNNVLAPFWTDLDGTRAPGIFVAAVSDGVRTWTVIEWQVNVFGTTSNRHFQVWLGAGDAQRISFVYDPAALPADPDRQPFQVGAENSTGAGGAQLPPGVLPTRDLVVTSSQPVPVGAYRYTLTLRGVKAGTQTITTELKTPIVNGATVVANELIVR